jgi:hypothetical protein
MKIFDKKQSNNKETLTVYWSPASYNPTQESWAFLYRDPEPLLNLIKKQHYNKVGRMFSCPATKDALKNVFVLLSALDDTHTLPIDYLKSSTAIKVNDGSQIEIIQTGGKISLMRFRDSSLTNYSNLSYNMKWVFFSEEPVLAKFTAPYFPTTTPADGAIFSTGKFDIGQWPRVYNLDYHIPFTTEKFQFNVNDHMFYLHVETNKKIQFKRFDMSLKLHNMCNESAESPTRYGVFKPLSERYQMAKEAKIKEQVLSEIKKNLV